MKKILYFLLPLALTAGRASAQPDQNVLGNVVIDNTNTPGYPYTAGVANVAGNVNLKGDVVFTGANPWILHTPNNRTTLFLAPGSPANWNLATTFQATGDVTFPQKVSIGYVACAVPGQCTGSLGINSLSLAVPAATRS